jgi:D-alanine--poly(phosphoribitol) ligase subunit 1
MKYANIYNIVTAHRITFALMVPSVLSYLKPYFDEIDLPDLRYSLFCGEALYKETITEWAKCVPGAVIENVYGPTEATIFCMTYPITNLQEIADYHGIVSIGKPMDGMDAVVTGENNTVLADGDKGELCLHGRQLTENYLNAGKNAGPFFILDDKKYYHTGDIAYKNEDGDFMYCGRVDNQVKIQGFRVELSEIEYHLRNSPGNPNVVAIAIESFNGMNQVDIVFEGEPINTDKIINELKTKLPSYMLPSGIHFVPLFPLNTNGKTDRKALEKIINNSI